MPGSPRCFSRRPATTHRERSMATYLLTARLDDRAGAGRIGNRIGIGAEADTFDGATDLFDAIRARLASGGDRLHLPGRGAIPDPRSGLATGARRRRPWRAGHVLRSARRLPGSCFPGSAALLALADEIREVRTICHCGKKATMVVRRGADGRARSAKARRCRSAATRPTSRSAAATGAKRWATRRGVSGQCSAHAPVVQPACQSASGSSVRR